MCLWALFYKSSLTNNEMSKNVPLKFYINIAIIYVGEYFRETFLVICLLSKDDLPKGNHIDLWVLFQKHPLLHIYLKKYGMLQLCS